MEQRGAFIDPSVISVVDNRDGDLLNQLIVEGDVDTTVPGEYLRKYSVTDSDGNRSEVSRHITVSTPSRSLGKVNANLKVLTRVEGVSPETVYFSAMDSTSANESEDLAGGDDRLAIAWSKFSYHFNFDDADAGYFATTGRSRNHQISGSPRAIHTFYCKGPDDPNWHPAEKRCLFDVRVRVQDSVGDYDETHIAVHIQSQASYYSAANTLCVSAANNWQGCPAGATHINDTPERGSFSGKRVLYQRGSKAAYSDIRIGFDEKNVTIDTYGTGARPLVYSAQIGAGTIRNNEAANALDAFHRDANGYVTAGWAYNITITGLRLGTLDGGHAVTLMTATDLDMDWSKVANSEGYGRAYFANRADWCSDENNAPDIDCSLVPYPYGSFITDSVIKGHASGLPLINIGCFHGCAIINSGMAGVEVKTANEHNSRIMGSWGLVVKDSWFRGDHIGGDGAKAKLTIRVPGFGATADQLNPNIDPEDFENSGFRRGSTLDELYVPHYASVINNIFNDPQQDSSSVATAFIHIDRYHRYSLAYGNKVIEDPTTSAGGKFNVIGLNGIHVYSMHNDIPNVYQPCSASWDEIEGYQVRSTLFAVEEDWSKFEAPAGSQCARIEMTKTVPSNPG